MRVSGELNQLLARFQSLTTEQRRLVEEQNRLIRNQNRILNEQTNIVTRIEAITAPTSEDTSTAQRVRDTALQTSRESEGRPRNLVFDLEYVEPSEEAENIAQESSRQSDEFRQQVVNDPLSTPSNQSQSSESSSSSTDDDLPSLQHFVAIRNLRQVSVGDTVIITNNITHGTGLYNRARPIDRIGVVKKVNSITKRITLLTQSGVTTNRLSKHLKVRTNTNL